MKQIAILASFLSLISSDAAFAQVSAAGAMGKYRREQDERAQRAAEALAWAKREAQQKAAEKQAEARNAAQRRQWEAEERRAEAVRQAKRSQEERERQRVAQMESQLKLCESAMERSNWNNAAISCRNAASLNDPKGQYYTARLMRDGLGIERDYSGAAKLFWQSANAQFVPALLEICKMMREGKGISAPKPAAAADCFSKLQQGGYDPYYTLAGEGERNTQLEAKELLIDMYIQGETAPPTPDTPAQIQADPEFRTRVWEKVADRLPGNALISVLPFGKFASMMSLKYTATLWVEDDAIKVCRAHTKKQDPQLEAAICDAIEGQGGLTLHIQSALDSSGERTGSLVQISM